MQLIVAQPFMATTIIGIHIYICATAKPQSQRTAGTTTPREGGTAASGHTKL
jgi:hypothetical protein